MRVSEFVSSTGVDERRLSTPAEDAPRYWFHALVAEEDRSSVLFHLLSADQAGFDQMIDLLKSVIETARAHPPSTGRKMLLNGSIYSLVSLQERPAAKRSSKITFPSFGPVSLFICVLCVSVVCVCVMDE